MTVALTGRGLACERDERELLHGLDLDVVDGTLLRIEGPNGSGKTSLLKMLTGQLAPTAGTLSWRGQPLARARADYRTALLYLGHEPGVTTSLTAMENLAWSAALADLCVDAAAIEAALQTVGLYGFEDLPAGQLSAGQRRRIALARLELIPRPLWILDEPFTALDRAGVAWLEQRLLAHRDAGGAVVLTTHHEFAPTACIERLRLGATHAAA
ncbi:cytochrome c biogenesis heme-transporting ATPase CcmA [Salinicola aestuarinus]|uniref:cytochrome c biogenesis heme-transporting ATPase CcmA n=1 Tax=Salinicola aestuarinus TaxID=1949082 RepID=UPI000DA17E75|nr:cytochrome c biogenesis heme-transporting ATPase CcmA [Salinicola aestuarinus]